jgi:AraC-like DNA-binding protein
MDLHDRHLPDTPRYTELAPAPELAPWIECYWAMRAANAPDVPNRVIPDGCSDIIVGLTDAPGPVAIGTMQTAAVFCLQGPVDYFGVRFRPGCALPFLGVPLRELTDRRVPLDQVWGADAQRLGDVSAANARTTINRVLGDRLRSWKCDARSDETLVWNAIGLMRRARGSANIGGVAAALGVGERRLERAFDRSVGIGPKVFGRVLRLRRALRSIEAAAEGRAPVSWTAVAFDAGYADQSHLIREFRALAGATPARYLAERRGVGFVQYEEAESV